MVVAYHSLHVQILHADGAHLAVVRERMGDFVKAVLAAVGYVFLQPGNTDAGLVAVGRTILFAAQPLLQQFQAVKASLQILRVLKRASVRAYGERLYAKVYAERGLSPYRCCRVFLNVRINQYGSEVSARRCHADGDGLHGTFEPAVQHGRNILCLGDCDCAFPHGNAADTGSTACPCGS